MRHADSHSGLTGRAATLWIRAIGLMVLVALLAWPVGSTMADDEKPGTAGPTEKSDDDGEADTTDDESAEAEGSDDESERESATKKVGRRINPTNRSSHRPGSSLQPGRPSKQPKPSHRRGRDRDTDDSTTESEDGATTGVDWESTFSLSDFESPPEERTYVFAFDDVDYGFVMNQWARMTGLPVLGDPPSGKVTYASAETLDYKTARARIRQLLYNHEKIYWMQRKGNVFEVMLMSDAPRQLQADYIKPSLESFEAAQFDDDEVAMLLYTPESGSVDDLQAIRDFMPDYMRTAPYQNSNSMTIFGKVIDIRKYLELGDLFSSAGDDPRTPLQIPVQHITATKAVQLLEQMMDHGRSRGGAKPSRSPRGKGSDSMLSSGPTPAMLIPFNEQKLILAKAIPKQIDEIYRLLELIDLPKLGEFNPIIIPLEHARADELVSIIYPLANGGSAKKVSRTKGKTSGSETSSSTGLNIIPEPRTNSLIVIGDEEQIAKVYKLVDMFDVPEREAYRIIDVMHVDAQELIETTNKLMGVRTSGSKKGATSSKLVMNPTPTGDSIIMAGPRQELDKAEQIIASLDLPSDKEEPTLHQAQLFNAKPSVVAEMLTGLDELEDRDRSSGKPKAPPKKGTSKSRSGSAGGRFFSDDASKTLFVMCTDQEWETTYQSRIQEFDRQAIPDTTLIEITYITPEEALTTLQQLFPPGRAGGSKGKTPGGSDDVRFVLTVGGLIVANASPAQIDKMHEVVAQIDVDPLADVALVTRIFDIQHADPTEVRALVETLVTQASGGKASSKGRQSRRGKGKRSDGSTIAGEAPMRIAMVGNRMVVSADAEVMEEIEELVASVDLPDPDNELRVYTFGSGTNVTSLSQELTNLFPNGSPRKRRGGGPKGQPAGAGTSVIRFIPQHVGRKLVVSAPPELFPEIEQAIEKLSPISDEVPLEWRVFTLEYAHAAEVVALVDPILNAKMSELYEMGELAGGADGKGGSKQRKGRQDGKLTIMPDATGGRIVVLAPSILMPEAEVLIKAFDVEESIDATVIRIVRVTNTDAEEMGNIIRAMISGQAPSPTPKRPRRGAEEKGRPRGIVIGGPMKVMVAAAPGGRSLVLSGAARDVEEVESWIHELDGEAESIGTFKVYQVTYSDPWELAETIMAFIDSGRGSGPKGADRKRNEDSLLGDFFEDFMPKSGPMIGREVIINVDAGSGTLVVQASPSKLRIVDELMELYEGKDGEEPLLTTGVDVSIPTLLYDLQHADAFDAVWTLQDYLGVLWNHPDPLPIVEEIPFTDTLVIKTNPKYFDEIKALIAERIDMPGADKSPTRVEWRVIDGAIASEVAMKLAEQLVGIDVDIEVSGLDMKGLEELIPPVQPYIPAKDSIDEDASCVLPLCVTSAWNGLVAAASGQTAAGEDADSEPTEEEIRQMLLQGSADGRSQASDEADLLTEQEADADDESDEPLPMPKVRIRIDDKTGALVVEGPDDIVQEVMYKLDDILEDIKEHPGRPDIRIYQLRYVDVDWAAQALDAMFNLKKASSKSSTASIQNQIRQLEAKIKAGAAKGGKGADPKAATADQQKLEALRAQLATASQPSNIFVYPIPRNQSLGIRANTGDFPAIVEFLATIDRPGETTFDFKIFELVNRKAEEVEQMVKLLLGLDKPVSKSRAPTSGKPNPQQQQIQQLQDQLSQFQGSGAEGLSARPDQIKITSDALTNSIAVFAPRQVIPRIEELIYQIENQPMPERVIKTYALANADATEVVGHLKELFPGGTGRSRAPKKGSAGASTGFDPGTVNAPVFMAVTRTNTVFVQALDIDIPKIEAEIERLDVPTEGDAVIAVKIKWGNPDSIARTLQQAFEDRAGGGRKGGGARGPGLKIIGDGDSNTVFIRGASPSLLEEIQAQIIAMDTREGTQPRSIKIAEGTPTEVAQIVEAVYGGGRGKRGSAGSVKVTGDDASKQLFVIAPDELFADIEKLVSSLDVPSGFEHKLFNLEFMKASDAVKQLDAIVRPLAGGGGRRGGSRGGYAAVADDRTQTIVAMGSPEILEQITGLLEKLDVKEAQVAQIQSAFFSLTRARANEMARNINNLFKQRRNEGQEAPRVEANQSTNSLIVLGTEEQIKQIREMIEKVENETTETPLKNEVFTLVHAKADEAAEMLKTFFQDRQRAYQQAKVQIPPAEIAVSITADVATDQVLVLATESNMDLVRQRIQELDQPGVGGKTAVVTRVYPIQYADPNGVVQAINGMNPRGGRRQAPKDRISATVEWQTSSVIVTASGENQERIAELIVSMDEDRGSSVREIYKMVNGRASDVADIANQIIRGGGRQSRQRGQQTTVVANDALNSVVVSGMRSKVDDILELIKSLDLPPDQMAGRTPQVYPLKYADPNAMIGVLRSSFPRVRGMRPDDYVDAAFAWGTGALVVTASQDNHAKVATLLEQIDVETGGRQTHVLKLKHANSDDLANRLSQIFGRSTRRARDEVPMSISSDPGTNSLIVFANDKELASIQELLEKIDVPQDTETGLFVEIYRVRYADPGSLINTITTTFRTPRRGSPLDEVRASYDWGTSTLVISASKEKHERIAALIAEVDIAGVNQRRTHIIKLKEANAEEIARGFDQFLRATRRNIRGGEVPMQVYANPGTNSLVIYATDEELAEIQDLLLVVDVKPDWLEDRQIKSFKLTYADAWGLRGMILEMFRGGRNVSPADQVTSMADWGSNALVVSASSDNMEQIEKLIAEVDKKDASQRGVHVVQADHADSLARALMATFGSTGRNRQQTITITNPPGTDSLLIKANDQEFEEIMAALDDLESLGEQIGGDVRVIRLEKSDAQELQTVVQEILRQPGSRSGRGGELAGDVRVSVIPSANALIISGETDELDRIEPMIRDLDFQTVGPEAEIIRLVNVDPSRIEPILTRMYGDSSGRSRGRGEDVPVIVADDMSKTLLVYASPVDFHKIEALVAKLDTPDTQIASGVKIIPVQSGINVSDLAAMLDSLLAEASRYESEALGTTRKQVAITADVRTNTIIAAGAPSQFAEVERIVRSLESMGPRGGDTTIILKTKNISADDIKRLIEQMQNESSSSSSRSRRR